MKVDDKGNRRQTVTSTALSCLRDIDDAWSLGHKEGCKTARSAVLAVEQAR